MSAQGPLGAVGEPVVIGLERCRADAPDVMRSGRFGLLMNQASVDGEFRFACDVLAELYPGRLRAIFSPQHGLWGQQQANMIESPHGVHPRLRIPVHSLYSETRRPNPEMLRELDCLVVDLQDVGTRVYTFIWTISHCLEACRDANIPLIVLDRPNPIGGLAVEGPLLQREYASFVGRSSIPMRHGCTLAELARTVNEQLQIGAQVDVVPMEGWERNQLFPDTGRHWIPPSPNMPRWETALVYPGQVLLEGTNLSEGRGTTRPFEWFGAPFIEPQRLLEALAEFSLPGVRFLPIYFEPTFDKWAGYACGGLSFHVVDAAEFNSYRTTVTMLAAVRRLWPNDFRWLPPPYEYEMVKLPIDILAGNSTTRERIDSGEISGEQDLEPLWRVDREQWAATVQKLYGERGTSVP